MDEGASNQDRKTPSTFLSGEPVQFIPMSKVRSLLDIQVEMPRKQLLTFLGHRVKVGHVHCEGTGILMALKAM